MFKQDQEIFNILLGSISEGVLIVDDNQNIVESNKALEAMFGYGNKELLKKPLQILIPPKTHKIHTKLFKSFMNDKQVRLMMKDRLVYGIRKDGGAFPVEISLDWFTVYNKNYVMALVRDITELKIIEQEKTHFSQIFNESLNEIYVFDAKTLKFLNVNYGAQKNLGYSLEELKQMTPLDIKPNFTEKEFRNSIEVLYKENVNKLEYESVHKRKDGTIYPIEIHLQLSNISYNDVFVAIVLDISERKDYTQKLEQTVAQRTEELRLALISEKEHNELKTKFLSLVSHEFKTPLSGILISATIMGKYKLENEQKRRDKHINAIIDKVYYLNNILNDFLSIEKMESGKLNYTPNAFKLSKVVNEVVYNANILLKEGQKINYPDNIDEFSLYHDEKAIELILSNLVHNAVKYSPENTSINIHITQNKKDTIIIIKDEGIGIPINDQKNIFQRYFRAENVLLTQGTGIGLNIVKSHLENLGGTISFISEEHVGSEFTVTIPNRHKQ
jgi:PAS domain S-box-containing protein